MVALRRGWWIFRSWPGWLQAIGWVLGWPVLAALCIAARASGTAGRVCAAAVLVVGGAFWYGALFAEEPTDVAAATSAVTDAVAAATRAASDPVASGSDASAGSSSASAPATGVRMPAGVPESLQRAVVEKIVDGDTIWVRVDEPLYGETMPGGATSKVRLLQVDTPEATAEQQCGGERATAFVTERMPVGSKVWLQADVEDTDRYGRFLRYVWLENGKMLNRLLVRRGYGEAVLYGPNDLHRERMRSAEQAARDDGRGLWGQWCMPEAAPEPVPESAPEVAPEPPPAPAPAPEPEPARKQDAGAGCHPGYTPCVPIASDVDCAGGSGDGPRYTGRVEVIGPDTYDLDRDGDGVACDIS